jgi:hypothetical protein
LPPVPFTLRILIRVPRDAAVFGAAGVLFGAALAGAVKAVMAAAFELARASSARFAPASRALLSRLLLLSIRCLVSHR